MVICLFRKRSCSGKGKKRSKTLKWPNVVFPSLFGYPSQQQWQPCRYKRGSSSGSARCSVVGQVSQSGGALSALQGVQDCARQSHGKADLVLAALLLWAGDRSGWPPEVLFNQHPCDFLLFTVRKPISSYAALPSKSGARLRSPVPNLAALLTLWTAGRCLQQVLLKLLCDMGACCSCSQLMGPYKLLLISVYQYIIPLRALPCDTCRHIPAMLNTSEAPEIRFSVCNVGVLERLAYCLFWGKIRNKQSLKTFWGPQLSQVGSWFVKWLMLS